MDAIEEALHDGDYDEIILSTLPRGASAWLHIDLPHRVAHLGLAADHGRRARGIADRRDMTPAQRSASAGCFVSVASRRVIER